MCISHAPDRISYLRVSYQLRDCGQTSIGTVSSTEMMQLLANLKPEWLRYEEQLDVGLVKMASVAKVESWRGHQSFFFFFGRKVTSREGALQGVARSGSR